MPKIHEKLMVIRNRTTQVPKGRKNPGRVWSPERTEPLPCGHPHGNPEGVTERVVCLLVENSVAPSGLGWM